MRVLKLGGISTVLAVATLALLWITEAIPRGDVRTIAPKVLGAIIVLVVAGAALSALSGSTSRADSTDKHVP